MPANGLLNLRIDSTTNTAPAEPSCDSFPAPQGKFCGDLPSPGCRLRTGAPAQSRRWLGSTRFWRQPKVGCINPPLPDIELNSATFAMAAWTAAEASSLMAANGSIALLLSTRQVWQGQIFPFLSRPYGLQPEVVQISYGPWVSFGVVGMTCSTPKSYPAGCMPRIGFAL